jgi:ABC-type iron transport system FetAB permease component
MTGQILAGADPVQAVRFQLLIVFTMMASATLTWCARNGRQENMMIANH